MSNLLSKVSMIALLVVVRMGLEAGGVQAQGVWNAATGLYQLDTPHYQLNIDGNGFKFGISGFGAAPIDAHTDYGLSFGGSAIQSILSVSNVGGDDEIRVQAANGAQGTVTVHALNHALRFTISPDAAAPITMQTSGLSNAPAYGLADAVVRQASTNLAGGTYQAMRNDGINRFGSSFLIHPSRRFAGVSFYPSDTNITTNNNQYSITTQNTGGAGDFKAVDFYYFMGDIADIYSAYKSARTAQGYPDIFPQSRLFEIGWESWDLLRSNANGETVRDAVQKFLDHGYPIKWLVTGSGFWQAGHTTTSFGYIDQSRGEYPDPTGPIGPSGAGFGTWTDRNNLAWLIGQRTGFVTPRVGVINGLVEGPFTQEADNLGYFVKNLNGTKFEYTSWAENTRAWLLDGSTPAASTWFQQKFDLWKAFGIDGVKEDSGTSGLKRSDVFNGPMKALADTGSLIMARNGAFTMPGTLHRINDSNGDFSNRAPISWLQYAASGAPNGYADSVGFSYMGTNPGGAIRSAWIQSLTGGMTFSDSPWDRGWSQTDQDALREAVDFRHSLAPYIYSAAVDSYETGYPRTMTPLYLAYPDDPNTYNLANTATDQYEWMVGPSLLAAPVFEGSDNRIDIYLPAGKWIDYNTGIEYSGNQTLANFTVLNDRPPVFVGGKGILVERSSDELTLTAEIYPVSPSGTTYSFRYMDGDSRSNIMADHSSWDPALMRVTDLSDGLGIPFGVDPVTRAIQFKILAGHDYRLISLDSEPGDFNDNGLLDTGDIDLLSDWIRRDLFEPPMDLNADSVLDSEDRRIWVRELAGTFFGDANLDREFNSSDLIQVFVAGTYDSSRQAVWSTGDFNGSGQFDSSDLVDAWTDGGYEQGPRAAAVPEPCGLLLMAGALLLVRMRRVRQPGEACGVCAGFVSL